MAGNNNRNGIVVVRLSHGAKAVGIADGTRDLAIGASFAVRDAAATRFQQRLRNSVPRRSSARSKSCRLPAKYSSSCLRTERVRVSDSSHVTGSSGDHFRQPAIEFQYDQRRIRDTNQQGPDRRRHSRVIKRFHSHHCDSQITTVDQPAADVFGCLSHLADALPTSRSGSVGFHPEENARAIKSPSPKRGVGGGVGFAVREMWLMLRLSVAGRSRIRAAGLLRLVSG